MNHEQEALEAAQAGRWDIATFHANMHLAQQLVLSREIAALDNLYNVTAGQLAEAVKP